MSTKKPAAKKAAKSAPKKTVAKKAPAKKAAVKKAPVAKKAAKPSAALTRGTAAKKKLAVAKKTAPKAPVKVAAKKATPAKKPVISSPSKPPAVPAPAKKKAQVSATPINGNRDVSNGVMRPAAGTIGSELWAIADGVRQTAAKDTPPRDPARFEYRQAVADSGKEYDVNSMSFQWFNWRKFHGIAGRAANRFPKRGTFETSVKEVKAPKPAPVPAAPKVVAPKPAKTEKNTPAKAVKPSAPVPAKKAANAPAKPADKPAPAPVSSRLAKVSAAAATAPTPALI